MGKHYEMGWGPHPIVFTETVDDPTAEVAVVRERRPGQFDWEFITVSPYRASHRFHEYEE